jgi:hypothetical protein
MAASQKREVDHSEDREPFLRALGQIYSALHDVAFDFGVSADEEQRVFMRALVTSAYDRVEGEEGREPSIARVALYCGITRNQAELILNDPEFAPASSRAPAIAAGVVLARWFTDARYSNLVGVPVDLSIHTQGDRPSFESLVREAAPEVDPKAVLNELTASRCVERVGDAHVRAVSQVLYVRNDNESRVLRMGRLVRHFVDTWRNNFNAAANGQPTLLELEVAGDRPLSPNEFLQFRDDAREASTSYLSLVDAKLNQGGEKGMPRAGIRCGIGLYMYVDRDSLTDELRSDLKVALAERASNTNFVDLAPGPS